jgi:hypothetical protein
MDRLPARRRKSTAGLLDRAIKDTSLSVSSAFTLADPGSYSFSCGRCMIGRLKLDILAAQVTSLSCFGRFQGVWRSGQQLYRPPRAIATNSCPPHIRSVLLPSGKRRHAPVLLARDAFTVLTLTIVSRRARQMEHDRPILRSSSWNSPRFAPSELAPG